MKKIILLTLAIMAMVMPMNLHAEENSGRIKAGVGLLYENGLDLTIGYEREGSCHNKWEYFANGYLQWKKCLDCGHICMDSFWKNYRTWSVGAAYKPCTYIGRNHYGNLRLGASIGSDTHKVIEGVHLGYEHSYVVRGRFELFWGVKTDMMIGARDLFRTGIVAGFKF